MRKSRICPHCDGRRFFDVAKATLPDPRYRNGVATLAIATHTEPFWDDRRGVEIDRLASIAAFVCAGCGYVELYTPGLATLERMAKEGVGEVRVVERDDD